MTEAGLVGYLKSYFSPLNSKDQALVSNTAPAKCAELIQQVFTALGRLSSLHRHQLAVNSRDIQRIEQRG